MKNIIIPIISSILVWTAVYAISYQSDPAILIEKNNRENVESCVSNLGSFSGNTASLQKELEKCSKIQLQSITWTASGTPVSSAPSQWYTTQHKINLSGNHDYRVYAKDFPNVAMWKNNNPSGITWHTVSNELRVLWDKEWIKYEKWTLRPPNEWWNYVLFSSIEEWLRAKLVSIRERWKNATVAYFLSKWGTDYIKLSFDTSKKIWELSDQEFQELFIQQLKKESPGLVSQLVKDWILIVE